MSVKQRPFKVVQSVSGTRNGVDWPPAGSVVVLPEHEGLAYVTAGLCEVFEGRAGEPVEDVERAVPVEKVEERTHVATQPAAASATVSAPSAAAAQPPSPVRKPSGPAAR